MSSLDMDENEIIQLQNEFQLSFRPGRAEYGPDNICLPATYGAEKESIDKFEVRDNDIFVAGHPKSGTHWMHELVWLVANDCDYEAAKTSIFDRYCLLEFQGIFGSKVNDINVAKPVIKNLSYLENLDDPRFIKTHLPWSLLPEQIQNGSKKPKIIVIAREPKDACVSFYHHVRFEGYKGSLENFSKLFLIGRTLCAPFWKNVLSYWEKRNEPNVLFVKYEDMKQDLSSVIRIVGNFLGKKFDDRTVNRLAEHLSFESMKNNPAVNFDDYIDLLATFGLPKTDDSFWMKGKVGSHKEFMSQELIDLFDEWTEANTVGTGLVL